MKPQYRRRGSLREPLQSQMSLALPAVPRESPLRAAFRRAELHRIGMDFRSVLGQPRAARLLRDMADAYERGHDIAARAYRRRLADMRRTLP